MNKLLLVGGALLLASQSFAGFVSVNPVFTAQADMRVLSSFNNDPNHLTLQYKAGGFQVESQGKHSVVSMKGAYLLHERGRPELPVLRWEVEVPSSNVRLNVVSERSTIVSADDAGLIGQVTPSLGSIEKIPGAVRMLQQNLDLSAYAVDAFYPSQVASIVQMGTVRGRTVATIELRPLQYNPVTKEIKFYDFVTVDVTPTGEVSSTSIHTGTSVDLATSKALNVSMLSATESPAVREKMIVVVADALKDNAKLLQYLQAKQSDLFEVETVALSQIGTTDVALRSFLRSKYSTPGAALTYVMLVGDVELVPTHDADAEVTDNYFASLDKPVYEDDIMYPEVSVGRLTVSNNAELDVVMNKYLKYQGARFPNTEWIKKIAFLATNDRYTVAEGTHNYVINSYTQPLNYSGIFPHSPEVGGDKLYAITNKAVEADVVKSMNQGRVLISYSGHGATTYWDAPRVSGDDVKRMPATDAFPYVMSHACVSGSYGMSGVDSFGEVWLKSPNAAIGFFGTSNSSYWDEDDILERVFFDGMYKEQIKSVGQLNQFGLAGVRQAFAGKDSAPYYYSIYNLLGDPTVQLFKSAPAAKEASPFAKILKF